MIRLAIRAFLLMVPSMWLLGMAGCGGGNARCDMRPQRPQCTDWRGSLSPVWTVQEGVCRTLGSTSNGGVFTEGTTCPVEEMWGGCQATQGDGSKQTNWYYKSTKYPTEDEAKKNCDQGMVWLPPQ